MDNISVNNANMVSRISSPAVNNVPQQGGQEKHVSEADKIQESGHERELENVVAVSKDGDTVQVSEEGTDRLANAERKVADNTLGEESFGRVTVRGEKAADNELITGSETSDRMTADSQKSYREISDSQRSDTQTAGTLTDNKLSGDEEAAKKADITSYAGYTDSQMEQLYLRGDISKIEYDLEMEDREQEREAASVSDNQFSKDMAYNINGINQTMKDAKAIDTALANDSAEEPLRADERLKMIEKLDGNIKKAEESKSEITQNNQQEEQLTVQVDNQTVQAAQAQNQLISEDGTVRLCIS